MCKTHSCESFVLPIIYLLYFQIPEFSLDGNSSLKHNGNAKDLASVMENLKKGSLGSRQNQSLNTQVTSSSQQVNKKYQYIKVIIAPNYVWLIELKKNINI